jgi:hypothetical protein
LEGGAKPQTIQLAEDFRFRFIVARGDRAPCVFGGNSRVKKIVLAAALAAVSFGVSGCASSNNIVLAPNSANYKSSNVALVYDNATVKVEDKKVALLNKYLEEALFDSDAVFAKGEGLTIKYGFIGYDEGSQAMRYLAGPLAGGAKMVIVAEFLDPAGNSLAKIQSEGTVAGGFFGGDSDSAIKGAAKQIAKFAEQNFAAVHASASASAN